MSSNDNPFLDVSPTDSMFDEPATRHTKAASKPSEASAYQALSPSPVGSRLCKREPKAAGINTKVTETAAAPAEDYRSQKARESISPVDGKTEACNRNHTFDSFVPERHLAQDTPQKRIGHTHEVLRAMVRMKKPLKKASKRASMIASGNRESGLENVARPRSLSWRAA